MIYESNRFYLILAASEIPERTKVTKPTGEKPHTLRKNIQMFSKEGKEVISRGDSFFLVADDGNLEVITALTLLKIEFSSLEDLSEWVEIQLEVPD